MLHPKWCSGFKPRIYFKIRLIKIAAQFLGLQVLGVYDFWQIYWNKLTYKNLIRVCCFKYDQPALRMEKPTATSMATIGDEDSATQSSHSSPSTPSISNPGTPRSELTQEVRATPPLPQPSISSSVQRTIPGQLQAQQAQVLVPQAHIQQQQQPLHQLPHQPQSKYSSLLAVIEDMGRDIRPTYAGNRTSSERLKRSIVHARILVRECLMECERSART